VREYGKVFPQIWTGDTGRELKARGPECQLIAHYLITGPSANMIGIYHLPVAMICCHINLGSPLVRPLVSPFEAASEALQRVCETGFAEYDQPTEMVFVPRMAEFQIGPELKPGDNRIKNITKQLDAVRKCRFVKDFYAIYQVHYHLPTPRPFEAPSKPLGKGLSEPLTHPLRSQEQEQEKEQEQEQKTFLASDEAIRPKASKAKHSYREDFERWYAKYPLKAKKIAAEKAFVTAVKRVCDDKNFEPAAAVDFLCERVELYAASPKGQDGQYAGHPATWLNAGSFYDAPAAWNQTGGTANGSTRLGAGQRCRQGPGQTYDPDAAAKDPNHGKF
jgi:hypothetical protein